MNKKIGIIALIFLVLLSSLTIYAEPGKNKGKGAIENYKKIEKTEAGLNDYKDNMNAKNNQVKNSKFTDIYATITFTEPISIKELEQYQSKFKLDYIQVNARAINESEERFTISSLTSQGLDVTDEIVKQQANTIQGGTFKGYTDVYALVRADKLDNMMKDKGIFLVDTSGDSKVNELINGESSDEGSYFPHALTWDKEDLGMN